MGIVKEVSKGIESISEAKWPSPVDFKGLTGKKPFTFGSKTNEYRALAKIGKNDKKWQQYLDDMASWGVTVEYDNADDEYIVHPDATGV
jgi:hypothetical protein